jgi:hypothetical protein
MRRNPTPSQQLEFARLRAFVATGFEDVASTLSLPPEHHPAVVADKFWAESPGAALRGLRAAAADVVEMLQDLNGPALAAVELRLAQAGAPSLSAMRDQYVNGIFRILNRGQIRSDEESRLINAVLSDVDDRILDDSTRELANNLLGDYEKRARSQ